MCSALGEVAQSDDETATTIARAFKGILRQAPDTAQHLDTLLHAAASAEEHPSFVIRRLGCDILSQCLATCSSDHQAVNAVKQLTVAMQVLS